MWPLISPPMGAPLSLIFFLSSECPVFHMTGVPPCASMSSTSACEHLTSKMISAGPLRQDLARQKRQHLVGEDDVAVLVDRADAVRVAVVADADVGAVLLDRGDEVRDVLEHGRVGMMVREVAVGLAEERNDLAPDAREKVARRPGSPHPFPQSATTLSGRSSLIRSRTAVLYGSMISADVTEPAALSRSRRSR